MKQSLRITLGAFLTVPFLMSLGCPGFQRSPCNYLEAEVEAFISHYELGEDSTMTIWFKATEKQESGVWSPNNEGKTDVRMNASEFEDYDLTIDTSTIDDQSILYSLNGTWILGGTCGQYDIYEVKRTGNTLSEKGADSTSVN